MVIDDPQRIVTRLREFQRNVRDMIVRGRAGQGLNEVSRSSSADTIYKIDTEVDPILAAFCEEWGKETPLVLIAEGLEDSDGKESAVTFPRGISEEQAKIRLIVDPIDGTRGIMYDKRPAWALAGVAPNKGPNTRLRDIEVAVMTELPTSKMGSGDVLWAIKGQGAHGIRERVEEQTPAVLEAEASPANLRGRPLGSVLTGLGKVAVEHVTEALNAQKQKGGLVGQILVGMGYASESDVQIALAFQKGESPAAGEQATSVIAGDALTLGPSRAGSISHGFASVVNFFPGTKVIAGQLMEHIAANLLGKGEAAKPMVFEDQYISTGGQFYEIIMGHDRFIADLRPAFHRIQGEPEGLCCHPYDCATLLIAEEAGAIITDEQGAPLDGPLDTTTGLSWIAYANSILRSQIEPLVMQFLQARRR